MDASEYKRIAQDWITYHRIPNEELEKLRMNTRDFIEEEFQGKFNLNNLIIVLRERGIEIPDNAGIQFLNNNMLTDKELQKKFSDLKLNEAYKWALLIPPWSNSISEIKEKNRWLIEIAYPDQCPKSKKYPNYHYNYELDKLVSENPEEAWKIISIIWKIDSSDKILANLAAGPVENLLCWHGPAFIERVEIAAKENEIFKKLLGAVWGENSMSPEVWKRLKVVAGETF